MVGLERQGGLEVARSARLPVVSAVGLLAGEEVIDRRRRPARTPPRPPPLGRGGRRGRPHCRGRRRGGGGRTAVGARSRPDRVEDPQGLAPARLRVLAQRGAASVASARISGKLVAARGDRPRPPTRRSGPGRARARRRVAVGRPRTAPAARRAASRAARRFGLRVQARVLGLVEERLVVERAERRRTGPACGLAGLLLGDPPPARRRAPARPRGVDPGQAGLRADQGQRALS